MALARSIAPWRMAHTLAKIGCPTGYDVQPPDQLCLWLAAVFAGDPRELPVRARGGRDLLLRGAGPCLDALFACLDLPSGCYAPPAVRDDTRPIATFESLQGAREAAEQLRAGGIKCAVVDPLPSSSAVFGTTLGSGYTLVVAVEDKARAVELLEGTKT